MKYLILCIVLIAVRVPSGFAGLRVGQRAPEFSAKASRGGHEFPFSLKSALKKGPVVVYFYPSAFTEGCDLEAHTFSGDFKKFKDLGATIIGVSQDDIERLNAFSADPKYCASKFPVASDPKGTIARAYGLQIQAGHSGMKDVRGKNIGHAFTERTTFVIDSSDRIVAMFSSRLSKISPAQHVEKALAAVRRLVHR